MLFKSPNYTRLSDADIDLDGVTTLQRKRFSARDALRWGILALVGGGLVLAITLNRPRKVDDVDDSFPDVGKQEACPQFPVIKTQSKVKANLEHELTTYFIADSFFDASVERLQGAVRIATESFDDMGKVGDDPRWDIFNDFHEYLEESFPLVFEKLEVTKVNTYGIVLEWKGSDEALKPYLFMAHQHPFMLPAAGNFGWNMSMELIPSNVVPVPQETAKRWTYEPFSAHFDGKFVWGRGATDCKNNLLGILEAFEALLLKDFKPERTMLTGFGFDEEISGPQGAKFIAKHLEDKWGKDSIDLIIDEGGMGIKEVYGTKFAMPALGEKGYFDVRIKVETKGGHSSVPPDHTGIGYLAQVIRAIEDHPYSPDLTPRNPFYTALQCGAEYGDDMDPWLRKTLKKSLTSKKAAKEAANYLAEHDITDRYLLQTSQAIDIISGGVKINALPEEVYAVVNHRVAVESSSDDIRSHLINLISSKILPKYGLSLDAWGAVSGNTSSNSVGKIELSNFDAETLEPSPVSPFTTDAYKVFSGTIKQVLGEDIIVAPTTMTGNTDTKWYWNLTKNIYRFSAVTEGGRGNAHTVDEFMSARDHVEGVRFYAQMVMNGDKA